MITNFPQGVSSYGVPQLGGVSIPSTTGKYIFVDSVTGSNGNNGSSPTQPVASISAAQDLATASKGDVVVIMPGHAETLTAVVTLSKAGVTYLGLGQGLLKPTITGNGAVDMFSLTGANIVMDNIHFAAPLTDAQTADVNVAAAGCVLRNLSSIGSVATENKTDIITVASGGNDLLVENCSAYNTVVDCVSWLSLEAAVARAVIRNCRVMGTFSTAVLMDEATATLAFIHNNYFKNTKTTGNVVTFTTGNTTGVMAYNMLSGRNTTIASNLVEGTGMDFFENKVVEEAALSGLLEPAVDAD